jgi:hypothetical protein
MESKLSTIPVLIGSARMPEQSELPPSIGAFAFLKAAPVDVGRDFHMHMERLLETAESQLDERTLVISPNTY